jgi:pimeloyl-ACP methyl ester carboxylesterase
MKQMKMLITMSVAMLSALLSLGQKPKPIDINPPGQLVDVGGYKLHFKIQGQGDQTIIIEAGGGAWSLHWSQFQKNLAKHAKVITYDRAGYGWSDASPYARTVEQVAEELHIALSKLDLKAPYIFAGHSYGGVVIKAYEKLYPQEVSGLIFYDGAYEGQFEILPPVSKMALQKAMIDTKRQAQEIRVGKLIKDMPIDSAIARSDWPAYRAQAARASTYESFYNEMLLFPKQSTGEIIPSKINKPICVVSAGNSFGAFKGFIPDDMINDSNVKWMELQKKIMALSTNSNQIILGQATHRLTDNSSDEMIKAALWVINEVRKSN